ncbi:MAG TPA: MurR/RpiR family transcriptional regulator [Alcaligenaceae bacterium]|nr:MurR/RpiR family transcriptional regulator [Alcaligenaceae bacterium]
MSKKNRPPQTLESLIQRLQSTYAEMPTQFQISARYLIDHPGDVPIASMRTIATQAGVQPATLVRLAQSLGYAGWSGLKDVFVQSLRQTPMAYTEQAKAVVRRRNPTTMLTQMNQAQARNVMSLQELNATTMAEAVELLVKAKRVYVAGFRASHAPAFTFYYLYRLFRPSVSMLRSEAGTLEMELRALQAGDVVVLTAFAPYSNEIVRVYEAAIESGCQVIALCDSRVAPIALESKCNLIFGTEVPSFFPSSTAAIALVEGLIEQILARSGKKALSGLQSAENQLHHTGAYWK